MNEEFKKWWGNRQRAASPNFYTPEESNLAYKAYLAGAAAMREKCAEVAEKETRMIPTGGHMRNFNDEGYNDACEDVATAIRKIGVE